MKNDKKATAKAQLSSIGVRVFQKDIASVITMSEMPSNEPGWYAINHKKVLMNDGSVHEYEWNYVDDDGRPSAFSAKGAAQNYRFTRGGMT